MYIWTYGLRKMSSNKYLKSLVWEDPSTSNMVNAPKNCWNLIESAFTIFTGHCEDNSVGKCLSEWYAKS